MAKPRKIVLELLPSGAPKITFYGERISKRELSRLLRATELQFRERVREYRRAKVISNTKKKGSYEHERSTVESSKSES